MPDTRFLLAFGDLGRSLNIEPGSCRFEHLDQNLKVQGPHTVVSFVELLVMIFLCLTAGIPDYCSLLPSPS